MVERSRCLDRPRLATDGDDQFDLVVQIPRRRRIGRVGAGDHQRVRRLREKERRLAARVVPHFAGVLGIVAADAEHPADGEEPAIATRDGDDGLGGRLDDVAGHWESR